MHDQSRVNLMMSRLAEEKRMASELSQQFSHYYFKDQAARLIQDADEIRTMFLGKNLDEWKPEEVERKLLNGIDQMIDLLIKAKREQLQNIFDQYGPDVMLIGG